MQASKKHRFVENEETRFFDLKDSIPVSLLLSAHSSHPSQDESTTDPYTPVSSDFWIRNDDSKVFLMLIFCLLDLSSLSTCSLVCKLWKQLLDQNFVWNVVFENYFGGRISVNDKSISTNWKNEFKREFKNQKETCVYGGNLSRSFVYRSRTPLTSVLPVFCVKRDFEIADIFSTTSVYVLPDQIIISETDCLQCVGFRTSDTLWKRFATRSLAMVSDSSDLFFLSKEGTITSRNRDTGLPNWVFRDDKFVDLLFYEEKLLCVSEQGSLLALEATTGKELWQIENPHKRKSVPGGVLSKFEKPLPNLIVRDNKCFWTCFCYGEDNDSIIHLMVADLEKNELIMATDLEQYLTLRDMDGVASFHYVVFDDVVFVAGWKTDQDAVLGLSVDLEKKSVSPLWIYDIPDTRILSKILYYHQAVWLVTQSKEEDEFFVSLVQLAAITGDEHLVWTSCITEKTQFVNVDMYVLDDILYWYGARDTQTTDLMAVDMQSGKVVGRATYGFCVSEPGHASHPNVKMVALRYMETVNLLWHA